jgi:DNA-binding XRE family transcriptional regulator
MNMPPRNIPSKCFYSDGGLTINFSWVQNAEMRKQPHFIREWRKHRGLNQVQLAERIGCTQGQISKIESFKKPYDEELLELAAEILRCEPVDLLIRNPSEPEGIWSIWDQLNPVQRQQLVQMGKVLAQAS